MAIRTFLTLDEVNALEATVLRNETRLRYIVRDAIHAWVFDPTTGRDRLSPIAKEPGDPHCEISALIPNWYYGILKWKSIGAGFHMREAFHEAILQWLALDTEGGSIGVSMEGNAAWMQKQRVSRENYLATMREVNDARAASIYRVRVRIVNDDAPKNSGNEGGHSKLTSL